MSKFWKIVVGILLGLLVLAAALYAITYFTPAIKDFAGEWAKNNNMPVWLAALVAPALYVFSRISAWLKKFAPGGNVAAESQKIQADRDRLRKDVESLLDWRNASLQREFNEITRLQSEVAAIKQKISRVDAQIKITEAATPESFTAGKSDHEVSDAYFQSLQNRGIAVQE
jgi:hypothetical protein